MRRAIFVFGCTMEDGSTVKTEDEDITAVKVHPDKSVEITRPDGSIEKIEGKWTAYIPRFN